MTNSKLPTPRIPRDTGARSAPTALRASVAALLGLGVQCVTCHGASIGDKSDALNPRVLRQETVPPTRGNDRSKFSLFDRQTNDQQVESPKQNCKKTPSVDGRNICRGLSPLVRLADQITGAATSATPDSDGTRESDSFAEEQQPKDASCTPPAVPDPSPGDTIIPDNSGTISEGFSPLVRLADQLAGPASIAVPNATAAGEAAESVEIGILAEEPHAKNACGTPPSDPTPLPGDSNPTKDHGNVSKGFSPLVRLADELAGTAPL